MRSDGFLEICLYGSAATDYDIVDATPFGRDPLKELAAECAKQGIKFGVYDSQTHDWHHPDGDGIRAVHLFGTTEILWEDPGLAISPTMRTGYEHSAAIARTQINETAFAAAWAEGQTMTLEQSLECARVIAQT